ncbi:PQQ-dependent sugar dehydrogenase [Lysobacter korlensis]|uniref:PQQ-dependent sugar dehydrogenase n=1 Tax=Lysobacter korlensis TaxID=553636 RepID=A0ABV6RRV8_9GAMM
MTRLRLASPHRAALAAATALIITACAGTAELTVDEGTGPDPVLPPPERALIPVVNPPNAVGWPQGRMPTAAPGLKVNAFATGLDHPRWLYVLPNGDVLVAETNAPPKDTPPSLRKFAMKLVMKKAGAAVPSANRITLLRDTDGDGVADERSPFLTGLNSPFGMALVDGMFYVANADAVVRVPYRPGDMRITVAPETLATLPGGPINHHWTKSLVASPDGQRLYVGVGSNSNVAEHGVQVEQGRAAIHEIDIATGRSRVFASGMRNPVGMDWEPVTGQLWAAVNERDEIGSDLVPDYITSVRDGGFYGWPYSYFGQHVDVRVEPQRPDLVARAIKPDYALGPHTASLGFTFYEADLMPQFSGGALIGQHGSWNRRPPSGYKVVYVPFADGRPAGMPRDVLTGFLGKGQDDAFGRPVGVEVARDGAILVADDVGNVIWRVTPEADAKTGAPMRGPIVPAATRSPSPGGAPRR